ncbi:L,D-transpeptidase family protein [Pontibacter chitinilyticus]|uniref:L,D-transpeptidase family protein n=1 Tax=Pontibacter chitinilyticus TaxID=2674989 RepID=UPI00321C0BE8
MKKKNHLYLPCLILYFLWLVPLLATANTQTITRPNTTTHPLAGAPSDIDSAYVRQYIGNEAEFRSQLGLVQQFYSDRGYTFAWFENGRLVPQADKLITAIENARKEGLKPKDYSLKHLRDLYRGVETGGATSTAQQQKQQLDLALTASYFNYASDFYKGVVDPHSAEGIEWAVRRNKVKLNKALEMILQKRASSSPYYEFEALHPGYKRLRDALVHYRELQEKGGWPKIEGKDVVRLNDTAAVVVAVRKRLLPQQQVNEQDSASFVYDQQVKDAVTDFQKRLGLTVDGILGPETYKALNVSVDERIDQILLNMERWRWLPKQLASDGEHARYVMVNIPAFRVSVIENGKEVMQMKAVVGEVMHSTPIFSNEIQYLMFSPYWNVPNSIVEREIKPHLEHNPRWLESRNMEMVTTFGPNAQQVPVSRVNWYNMTEQNFRYRIRQRPGPTNALGRVKFMFPNEYAVYLHDTPADQLFSETDRDFSHGCVRVERPADLATYLLQDKPGWGRDHVVQAMHAREQQRVDLPENVPVYLVYFTAWADEDGTVHFRDDLYGHDKALAQRLF